MIKLFSIIFLILISNLQIQAELRVGINIDSNGIIREGAKVKVSLSVAGSTSPEDPKLEIQGGELNQRKTGKSFRSSVINQRITSITTHTYELTGSTGKYSIKGIFKSKDGTLYETDSVNLQIREKTAQEKALDPKLVVRLAKNNPYVGEPVLAEITLLLQPRTRLYLERNNIASLFGEGIRVNFIDGPKEASPINNQRAMKFLYEISSLKSGDLSLAASYTPLLQIPSASGRRLVDERFNLKSKVVTIKSKELPKEGKPSDFSGAIGKFSLDLQADPLKVNIGDPIALRFTISGNGGFEFIDAPSPTEEDGWKFYKPTKLDLQRGEGLSPSKLIFSQNLVAERIHTELPTFRFTVFDSEKEQYVTLISDKIPVQISKSGISLPSKISNVSSNEKPSSVPLPNSENKLSDILVTPTTITPTWSVASSPVWRNRSIWVTNIILIGLLIVASITYKKIKTHNQSLSERTPKRIIAELKTGNLSSKLFYTNAYECFSKLEKEKRIKKNSPIIENLIERYEQINFSRSKLIDIEENFKKESAEIITELTSISKIENI